MADTRVRVGQIKAAAKSILVQQGPSDDCIALTIDDTKIAVGDGSQVVAASLSSDVQMANTGAVTIQTNAITTPKISNNNVTLPKIQQLNGNVVLGKPSAGSGNAQEVSIESSLAGATNKLVYASAVKSYVDAFEQGIFWKEPVKAATTGHIAGTYNHAAGTITAASNGPLANQDGQVLNVNDRLLLKNQSTGNEKANGIYVVTQKGVTGASGSPYILTRALDLNESSEIPGAAVFVKAGTVHADSAFVVISDNHGDFNADAINWEQFTGLGQVQGGIGIQITGNTIDIDRFKKSHVGNGTLRGFALDGNDILGGNASGNAVVNPLHSTSRDPFILVYLNGVLQNEGSSDDYFILKNGESTGGSFGAGNVAHSGGNADEIIFKVAPSNGDIITLDYFKA